MCQSKTFNFERAYKKRPVLVKQYKKIFTVGSNATKNILTDNETTRQTKY